MGALAPAVRPCTGGAFGKKRRSAAPAAFGGVVKPSSRAQVSSVIKKVEVNGVMVEMEVIPLVAVGGGKAVVRGGMERLGGVMARGSSVCVAGFNDFVVPTRKATKITSRKPNKVEIAAGVGILTSSSKTPVDPTPEILKKRLAAELDALRDLIKKAEHMSCVRAACKLRPEAKTDDDKTPSVKKTKISPQAEQMQMPATSAEANKIEDNQLVSSVVSAVIKIEETGSRKNSAPHNDEDEDEFVDICGGVSPITIQETTTVLSPLEDGEISGNTPSSSSSSSSSSESDSSSSDSDSDSDAESVDSPVSPPPPPSPLAVPSEEKNTAPPEQLASAVAIDKAKLQQELLEMETAALPDESIHARDLQCLGIAEYGRPSVMQQLGLFLNDDAPTSAGKTEQSVASKRRSEPWVAEADGKPPLLKKRKISAPVEPTQKMQPLPPCPAKEAVQSAEPKNVVQPPATPKAVYMPGLIYRAKLRLALLEMERTVLPDESIHARDLQSLGIAEHGRPSVMRQLGLFLEDA